MKTPTEFDYDLWTAKDGKRMVRVKCTGEVCEVDEATFRFLRKEEKALRRSMQGIPVPGSKNGETFTVLSLDYISSEEASEETDHAWSRTSDNTEETVMVYLADLELRSMLTEAQLGVYEECLLGGLSYKDYATLHGVSYQRVQNAVNQIRIKASNFF